MLRAKAVLTEMASNYQSSGLTDPYKLVDEIIYQGIKSIFFIELNKLFIAM
jgi:hypothetical protein